MDVERTLRETFGLIEFRPGQRIVVDSVLSGRPTVAVMPTGAGKSLCYQLPAIVAGGTALVVSPLISLMKDQVDALAARGISACAITSALGSSELGARIEDVARGRVRLCYVAPERFRSPRFEDALDRLGDRLSLLAVDEAHCISEWGHDFRPDYLRIGEVVARRKPPRLLAVTATATPEVRRDIVRRLAMEDPSIYVRGFDRPNLRFVVERVSGAKEKLARLAALVAQREGRSALVYAATRKNAEGYADELRRLGVVARPYHAGLDDDARSEVQDAFMSDEVDVIVATNAFGMGVDKKDVRLVVHVDLPRSPEAYYQEAGRAGRDGEPADCVLLFQQADVRLQEFLIDAGAPSVDVLRATWRAIRSMGGCDAPPRLDRLRAAVRRAVDDEIGDGKLAAAVRLLARAGFLRERDGVLEAVKPGDDLNAPPPAPLDAAALEARVEVERSKLRAMAQYAYSGSCRRRYLLQYFGDEDAPALDSCGACDVCEGGGRRPLDEEERSDVRATLSLIARLRGRFGRTRIASILVGSDDDDRLAEAPERGRLRARGQTYALDLVRALEGAALVVVSAGEYPTVAITTLGRKVADGVETVELAMPRAGGPARGRARRKEAAREPIDEAAIGPIDGDVLARLRAFRQEEARREELPAYCILSNKTIEAIARRRPADLDALSSVPGIGPAKLEKYGRTILDCVRG